MRRASLCPHKKRKVEKQSPLTFRCFIGQHYRRVLTSGKLYLEKARLAVALWGESTQRTSSFPRVSKRTEKKLPPTTVREISAPVPGGLRAVFVTQFLFGRQPPLGAAGGKRSKKTSPRVRRCPERRNSDARGGGTLSNCIRVGQPDSVHGETLVSHRGVNVNETPRRDFGDARILMARRPGITRCRHATPDLGKTRQPRSPPFK